VTARIAWQKSSFSGGTPNNDCVELGASPTAVHLRESDAPGTVITPHPTALRALIRGVQAGEFDRI